MQTELMKISIGGQEFPVSKPLTFEKLSIVEPLLREILDDLKDTKRFSQQNFGRIGLALTTAVDDGKLTIEMLKKLHTNSIELSAAFKVICEATCVFSTGQSGDNAAKGEADASIGDTSTLT